MYQQYPNQQQQPQQGGAYPVAPVYGQSNAQVQPVYRQPQPVYNNSQGYQQHPNQQQQHQQLPASGGIIASQPIANGVQGFPGGPAAFEAVHPLSLEKSVELYRRWSCCGNFVDAYILKGNNYKAIYEFGSCPPWCSLNCCCKTIHYSFKEEKSNNVSFTITMNQSCIVMWETIAKDDKGNIVGKIATPSFCDQFRNVFTCGNDILGRILDNNDERLLSVRDHGMECGCFGIDFCNCCSDFKHHYPVCFAKTENEVGSLEWSGEKCCFQDKKHNNCIITFPEKADVRERIMLVGFAFMLDGRYAQSAAGCCCKGDPHP